MKKFIYGVVFLFLLVGSVVGYSYNNYHHREAEIAKVLKFKDKAFKAYGTLLNGNYKEAKKLYDEALVLHDRDPKTLRDYALCLSKLGKNQKACEVYEKAYHLDAGKDEKVLANLASVYFKTENYLKSSNYYRELIERFRPRYRYIESLIVSLQHLNREDEAMGYYAFVMQNSPNFFVDKFPNLKAKYTKETKALPLRPKYESSEDIDALLKIARDYSAKGYDKKALLTYYKIINKTKTHEAANKEVSVLLLKHNDTKNALPYLENIANKDFDTLFKIGGIHHQNKRYKKAVDFYELALREKESPMLLKNLAACSFYLKDIEKVELYLAKLKKVDARLAYNFEYAILIKSGVEMTQKDKITNQLYNMWFDIKDSLKG